MHNEYVKFPNKSERCDIPNAFSAEHEFPPVVCGIIDGTQIEIQWVKTVKTDLNTFFSSLKSLFSSENKDPVPEKYFYRKGYYSLNLMCVVDHVGKIPHFTCRHPGSAHDANFFWESTLRPHLLADFDPKTRWHLWGTRDTGPKT